MENNTPETVSRRKQCNETKNRERNEDRSQLIKDCKE